MYFHYLEKNKDDINKALGFLGLNKFVIILLNPENIDGVVFAVFRPRLFLLFQESKPTPGAAGVVLGAKKLFRRSHGLLVVANRVLNGFCFPFSTLLAAVPQIFSLGIAL